jgi:hydrogenase expression/formation protein HypE
MPEPEKILLAHGGGGRLSEELIRNVILPQIPDPILQQLDDGATIQLGESRLAFSTDSFTIDPPFFPGGNIGSLAAHGTINDLCMMGADPLFLSSAIIVAEGFPIPDLQQIVHSLAAAARSAGARIVTGDTKVVSKAALDSIFINTTGIGLVPPDAQLGRERIQPGDRILLSGTIADHGVAILCCREGIRFDAELLSDSAPLHSLTRSLRTFKDHLKFMRDPTRGGVAAVLNELVAGAGWGLRIEEEAIPLRPRVQAALEILGLDPLHVANEGKLLAVVSAEVAEQALAALRALPLGRDACLIGEVVADPQGLVIMRTALGGERIVDNPAGELLPRIC